MAATHALVPSAAPAEFDFFDVGDAPPSSSVDLALWDKACSLAESWRGLGLEALRCAVPRALDGKKIYASCPWPALITPIAQASASKALAAAFNIHGLSLELEPLPEGSSLALSWRSRHEALRDARRAEAHASFQTEELPSQLAQSFGAIPELPTFVLDEPPLE